MNLSGKINVGKFVAQYGFTRFFLGYILAGYAVIMILELLNRMVLNSEIFLRLEFGIPIILQTILAYKLYSERRENKSVKIILYIISLHTIISMLLGLYEVLYTEPWFGDELFYNVVGVQILLQLVIITMVVFLVIKKRLNKRFIVKPMIMLIAMGLVYFLIWYIPFWSVIFILSLIGFNPITIYVLINLGKEERMDITPPSA